MSRLDPNPEFFGSPGEVAAETAGPAQWDLDGVVADLERSRDVTHNVRHLGRLRPPPLREAIGEALIDIAAALFPAHYGPPDLAPGSINDYVRQTLDRALSTLSEQASAAPCPSPATRRWARIASWRSRARSYAASPSG